MSEKNGRRVSMVSTTTVQEQQQLYRPLCMTEVNVTHRFVEPWVWHFGRRHLCLWNQKLARDIYKTCVISRPLEVKEKLTFCILNQFILDKMLQVKTGCWSRTESVPCWRPRSPSWPNYLLIYLKNWNGQLFTFPLLVGTTAAKKYPVRLRSTNPDLSAVRRQSKTAGRVNKLAGF